MYFGDNEKIIDLIKQANKHLENAQHINGDIVSATFNNKTLAKEKTKNSLISEQVKIAECNIPHN